MTESSEERIDPAEVAYLDHARQRVDESRLALARAEVAFEAFGAYLAERYGLDQQTDTIEGGLIRRAGA